MFERVIVPVDGSHRSWAAARLGAVVARICGASLELVHVVFAARQTDHARRELRSGLLAQRALAVEPDLSALVGHADEAVGTTIARHARAIDGTVIVMSSAGRGRAAGVLGSVADEVIRTMADPIIVVGPSVDDVVSFGGDIVVPVDGSTFSETTLPIAATWSTGLGATPWIVEVVDGDVPTDGDLAESAHVRRLTDELRAQTGTPVEFDVLRGGDPGRVIAEAARRRNAGMVMMSTHGRSGVRRLTIGSTAATVVRHAPCPVVLHRPPELDRAADGDAATGSASHEPGR